MRKQVGPLATLRVDGYIRVSRVGKRGGERFISPDVQRDQIGSWAVSQHVTLLRVFEELDESGARADRPLLLQAIARIEAGVSDGLVVSKVNRFGRSLIDGLVLIDRVQAAGGRFFSVIDGLDTATDSGRLVLRMMLAWAEWDLDRIRTEWRIAQERAIERGVFVASSVPPGYRKSRSGRLRLHPAAAPVMAEAFRRRADGQTLPGVCRFLEAQGLRTGHGNPGWTAPSLGRLLRSRVYLGELRKRDCINENAHPPLIDPVTWERAQRPRQLSWSNVERPVLLGGLLRCAGCSMLMTKVWHRHVDGSSTRTYYCRAHFSLGTCPANASVFGDAIDEYVTDAFFALLKRRRRPPIKTNALVEQRLLRASADLVSYRDNDRLRAVLGDDRFVDGVAVRQERVREARLALADSQSRVAAHELPPLAEIRQRWPTMQLDEQRLLLSQAIDCVFVARGPRVPLRYLVTICPTGTGPANLSYHGPHIGNKLRTIQPRRGWMNPAPLPED